MIGEEVLKFNPPDPMESALGWVVHKRGRSDENKQIF